MAHNTHCVTNEGVGAIYKHAITVGEASKFLISKSFTGVIAKDVALSRGETIRENLMPTTGGFTMGKTGKVHDATMKIINVTPATLKEYHTTNKR